MTNESPETEYVKVDSKMWKDKLIVDQLQSITKWFDRDNYEFLSKESEITWAVSNGIDWLNAKLSKLSYLTSLVMWDSVDKEALEMAKKANDIVETAKEKCLVLWQKDIDWFISELTTWLANIEPIQKSITKEMEKNLWKYWEWLASNN